MRTSFLLLIIFFIFSFQSFSQNYKVLESTANHVKIEFDFYNSYRLMDTVINGRTFQMIKGKSMPLRKPGEPWLPAFYVSVAAPRYTKTELNVLSIDKFRYDNKFILPLPAGDTLGEKLDIGEFDQRVYGVNKLFPVQPAEITDDYIYRYSRILIVSASPFQFNPVSRELIFNRKIVVEVKFTGVNPSVTLQPVADAKTSEFIRKYVVNSNTSLNWIAGSRKETIPKAQGTYWYNPNKKYYKIYTSKKGIYRITFQQLVNAGMVIGSIPLSKLELFNGGKEVPIYITDQNNNGYFNTGDYFEFVAYPPAATPYAASNIYNLDNVYFFTTEADSSGLRYTVKDGYPQKWDATYQTSYTKLHFEKDSLYENLGYAGDEKRDFWLWGRVLGNYGSPVSTFAGRFDGLKDMDPDSNRVTVRVQMQGLSTSSGCQYDHDAIISLTNQYLGDLAWNGQQTATFEKQIYVSNDSIKIYPSGNLLQVKVTGNACPTTNSDVIDVNWFEIEYWKDNRADSNHIEFTSPPNRNGIFRYWTWKWQRDSILVFIPGKASLIKNAFMPKDQYDSAIFVDTVNSSTDYFCAGYDYFNSPDSIITGASSDLRNTSNGADYIIITHPDFQSVAERLASFRASNFPDSSIPNPRIKIVYVNQIYDEFSYGLLDPYALKDFIKYAFDNWKKPAPAYVVLLGDMSHDYRHLLPASRPSFVPSIPYYTNVYGEGVSDNSMVSVSGDDIHPDMAIGRLSCETVAEGNILLDKLVNYPADNTKQWKQNILLVSAGLSTDDENILNLNEASMELAQDYVDPTGLTSTKIMSFPNKPEYQQYLGGGPEIRNQIDNGTALVNYYGHGGGYQWDLVFLNDDIYLLNNGGRLPLIVSVTCYTAHFDDQDVFGEQFNKVPGKGSIGFFGNVGLTYWVVGKYFDDLLFNDIFTNKNYIFGKAVQDVKDMIPAVGNNSSQIALLTYLGDPVLRLALPDKPDFSISSNNITVSSQNIVAGDSVEVEVKVDNLGVVFPGDSVTVQLYAQSSDTSYNVGERKLGNFAHQDSVFFNWTPSQTGLFTLTAKVNEKDQISEADHSDNIAETSVPVYNLTQPSIVSPPDGYTTDKNFVEFKLADIGAYINKQLTYFIEIDTSISFPNPVKSPALSESNGEVKWDSPQLPSGSYFWRTRIYDGQDSSNWSPTRTFQTNTIMQPGYFVADKQLQMFHTDNLVSTDSGLIINSGYNPPRPSSQTFIEDWKLNFDLLDSVGLTAITSDGTYIYFGNIFYYAQQSNPEGNSRIYKLGTGNNGTLKGIYYGYIPKFYAPIKNSIFYFSDGYIYVTTGQANRLIRVNKTTGDTSSVIINDGLIRYDNAQVGNGFFYLASDGKYVYNLAIKDPAGNNKYTLRIFDPRNNWALVRPDYQLSGTSYDGFTGFFVAEGYIFPYENYYSGFMRRIRISDGFFEEEWLTNDKFQGYYAWAYDQVNNRVYATVFRNDLIKWPPKISIFTGKFLASSGTASTVEIGPAASWKKITYYVQTSGQTGKYMAYLFGKNSFTKTWDTLSNNLLNNYNIGGIKASQYSYLKLQFLLNDSTYNIINPIKLRSLAVYYDQLPEVALDNSTFEVDPDTVIKKVPLNISFNVRNLGDITADSINIKMFLNDADKEFFSKSLTLESDSTSEIKTALNTADLLNLNSIKAVATLKNSELYTFNNIIEKSFYVIRDTAVPKINITFDGKEIISGDIVSSKPKIDISMYINSPLPLDTSTFMVLLDNQIVSLQDPGVKFKLVSPPLNGVNIMLSPPLKDGQHSLDILVKDQSGQFTDSLSSHLSFVTYNDAGLRNVYNYPNPFNSSTFITFQMTGQALPSEMYIKIYTVAGRLIKNIPVQTGSLTIGFNKIYWDGRDEDGDLVANGLYFYKIVYKNGEIIKTYTQKLAIIR